MSLWHRKKGECARIPKIIITGFHETLSKELKSFLEAHLNLETNKLIDNSIETDFFTDSNYFKGIDW